MGHKENSRRILIATGNKEKGMFGQFILLRRSGKVPTPIEYHSEGRGIFPNPLSHYGLLSDCPYYSLATPAYIMPGVIHSIPQGTQSRCFVRRAPSPQARVTGSGHYIVAFYDILLTIRHAIRN